MKKLYLILALSMISSATFAADAPAPAKPINKRAGSQIIITAADNGGYIAQISGKNDVFLVKADVKAAIAAERTAFDATVDALPGN